MLDLVCEPILEKNLWTKLKFNFGLDLSSILMAFSSSQNALQSRGFNFFQI